MSFLSSLVKVALPVAAAVATGGASAWATAALSAVDAFAGDGGKGGAAQGAGGLAETIAGAAGASAPVAKLAGKAVETLAGAGSPRPGTPAAGSPSVTPSAASACMCSCSSAQDDDAAEDLEDAGDDQDTGGPTPSLPAEIAQLGQCLQAFIAGGGIAGAVAKQAIGELGALANPASAHAWLQGGWGNEPVR